MITADLIALQMLKSVLVGQQALTFARKALTISQKALTISQKALTILQKALTISQKSVLFAQHRQRLGQQQVRSSLHHALFIHHLSPRHRLPPTQISPRLHDEQSPAKANYK